VEKLKFIYPESTYTFPYIHLKTGEMIPVKQEKQTPEELAALLKELRAENPTLTCSYQCHIERERNGLDQISGLNPDLSLYTKDKSLLFEYEIDLKLEKHVGDKPMNFIKRFAIINVSTDGTCDRRKVGLLNTNDLLSYNGSTRQISLCRPLMYRDQSLLLNMSGHCTNHSTPIQEWETKEWCATCRGVISPDKLTAIMNRRVTLRDVPDAQIKFIGTKVIPIDWNSNIHINKVVEIMKADQAFIKVQTDEIHKIKLQKTELYGKITACERDEQIAADKIEKVGHDSNYCDAIIKIAEIERVRIAEMKKHMDLQEERVKLLQQLADLNIREAQNTDTLRKIHTGQFEINN